MGVTNNIKEVLQDYQLKARSCYSCSNPFTDLDLKENNWTVEYRNNHDTNWQDFPLREGRGWISIEIALYHEECLEEEIEELDQDDKTDEKPEIIEDGKCEKCGYDKPVGIGRKFCPSCWLEQKEKNYVK